MPDLPDPVREQFVKARRKQILEGAAKVFALKGYHNATNKDIAEAAGVSYGLIYTYFKNKAELLVAILNQLDEIELREGESQGEITTDFQTVFKIFLSQHQARYLPNMAMFKAILPEVLINPELRQIYRQQNVIPTEKYIEKQITNGIQRGELRQVNAGLAAKTLEALLLGSMLLQLLGEESPATTGTAEELADLLFSGLASRAEH